MSSGTRVLHVLFGDTVGGVETLCFDLMRQLEALGLPEEIVFLQDGDQPARRRLAGVGAFPVHTCVYDARAKLRFIRSFGRLVRSRRIDAVVVYALGFHLLPAIGARLGGARRVLTYVGNPPPADARLLARTRLSAQLARPFVSREVACSRYVAETMVRHYRLPSRRIAVVHNGCDVGAIAARADAVRRARTDAGPVFGMVARLDPIKDHATLVRAFAKVRTACPGARLVLVGDGPTRGAIESLVATLGLGSSVEITGVRSDVPAELGRLDVFVMSATQHEGFGTALAEALGAGVAAVATDIGPCPEVLGDGEFGLLVPPCDPDSMADAMLRLWRDGELRTRLATAGARGAAERYNARLLAERYRELIES